MVIDVQLFMYIYNDRFPLLGEGTFCPLLQVGAVLDPITGG